MTDKDKDKDAALLSALGLGKIAGFEEKGRFELDAGTRDAIAKLKAGIFSSTPSTVVPDKSACVYSDSAELACVPVGAFARMEFTRDVNACLECQGIMATRVSGGSQPCHAFALDKERRRYNGAKIPAAYFAATLEDFAVGNPLEKILSNRVKEWLDGIRPGARGLWLAGPVGVGKTHLLCAITRALVLAEHSPRYVLFADLVQELKASFSRNSDRELDEILGPLASIPFLVIDDLGSTRRLFELETFEQLILKRSQRLDVTTIVASNYTPQQIGELARARGRDDGDTLDSLERTVSRLSATVELIPIVGSDKRQGKRK